MKLLKYLLKHKHFSPFEHAYLTMEITTTRAIAAQILRHRSFVFQEFSQRYAEAVEYLPAEARKQDLKNRQNSTNDLDEDTQAWFYAAQLSNWENAKRLYDVALRKGVAKECARMILPLNTKTVIYMTGSARSWIHYCELRASNGTQKEHMDIALACKQILVEQLPAVAEALDWK